NKIDGFARYIGQVVRGAAHVAGDRVQARRYVGGAVSCVQERGVQQVVELRQLLGEVFRRGGGEVQGEVGLHLAYDAADLLAAQDAAAVRAALDIAGLASDDAADVVAH